MVLCRATPLPPTRAEGLTGRCTSDARLLSAIFAASDSHDGTAPAPRDLSDDRAELGIEPLFDGARLENVRVG